MPPAAPPLDTFNLLYPAGTPAASTELSPAAWHDLGLDQIVWAFSDNRDYQTEIRKVLSRLIHDPAVLLYRQQILDDLLQHPALVEQLSALLPVIDSLTSYSYHLEREKGLNLLHELTWRVGELQNIVDCLAALAQALLAAPGALASPGLQGLLAAVQQLQATPVYQNLAQELPELLATLRVGTSLTIGVNLDLQLRPIQATLLAVNEKPFTGQSLLNRLFGSGKENDGLGPLHSVPQRLVKGPDIPITVDIGAEVAPMLVPLFNDLSRLVERSIRPVVDRLKHYAEVQSKLFINLRAGLIFYLHAVRFFQTLQAQGLPVCRPALAPADDRLCQVQGAYNVNLALQHAGRGEPAPTIANDIGLGPAGRILILTGPNQGGKTTYLVGVGLVQVLAQVGCFVPGTQATLSPVDQIFTHFPIEEKPEAETGRLGEEAQRLGKIFEQVTRHSLVLLNESLSSTGFSEGLYLAQDVVRLLRRVGARGLYSTHLYELAGQVEALNQSVPGDSRVISVVSSPVTADSSPAAAEHPRSYKIEVRPPLGQSYAREIAARYGLHYQQLEQALARRGVLPA